jgi:signal transduction histidine kinase
MDELERLRAENAQLNEQLKLLVRTEQNLFAVRGDLQQQLRRIRVLNDFALAAMRSTSPTGIAARALELLVEVFSVQGAIAIVHESPDSEWTAERPHVLVRLLEGDTEPAMLPADVAELVRSRPWRATGWCGDASDPASAPLVRWLDELTAEVEGELRGFPSYVRRDVVMPIGTRDLLVFRNATVTPTDPPVDAGDLPFLEIIGKHVSSSLETSRLHATLEQRVLDRTWDLRVTNQQLADSVERLTSTQRQLVEASRKAGMSEVATSVLHNVGNVLNSVNVSATLVQQKLDQHRGKQLRKVATMVDEQAAALLTDDPRARQLPAYLGRLVAAMEADDAEVRTELVAMRRSVDHIKAVIMMQQDLAKGGTTGMREPLAVTDVVEDALAIERAAYESHGVEVVRDLAPLPTVIGDRHTILQILTNLLSNARHAVSDDAAVDRRVTVRTAIADGWYRIEVADTGCGITAENLPRIFNLGFTTKPTGHGFGLHSSACRAVDLGGRLTCASEGPGQGAVFRLELPVAHAPRLGPSMTRPML